MTDLTNSLSTRILGMGSCKPEFLHSQNDLFDQAKAYCGGTDRQVRALKHLYDRTTIQSRGTVLNEFFPEPVSEDDFGPTTAERMLRYELEVPTLALHACESALADALTVDPSMDVSSICGLVTVSCTGFYSPGFDIELIDKLGLNRDVSRSHIGYMGCHGAMNGLRVADALIQSKSKSPGGRILLCAAEICSLHFHYGWNSDNLLANSLFADGAAALVLGNALPDQLCPGLQNWQIESQASYIVPNSLEAMSWRVRDNGFVMTLSAMVPDLIHQHLGEWITSWLESIGKTKADIGAWAIHPGGAKILDAAADALKLSDESLRFSRDILQQSGNMSSPTVLFILEKIRAELGCVPTVMLAFGPGLTIEAAYLSALP